MNALLAFFCGIPPLISHICSKRVAMSVASGITAQSDVCVVVCLNRFSLILLMSGEQKAAALDSICFEDTSVLCFRAFCQSSGWSCLEGWLACWPAGWSPACCQPGAGDAATMGWEVLSKSRSDFGRFSCFVFHTESRLNQNLANSVLTQVCNL